MTTEDLQGQVARSAAVERELREEIGKLRAELAEARRKWRQLVDDMEATSVAGWAAAERAATARAAAAERDRDEAKACAQSWVRRSMRAATMTTAAESALAEARELIDAARAFRAQREVTAGDPNKPGAKSDYEQASLRLKSAASRLFPAALARAGEQGSPKGSAGELGDRSGHADIEPGPAPSRNAGEQEPPREWFEKNGWAQIGPGHWASPEAIARDAIPAEHADAEQAAREDARRNTVSALAGWFRNGPVRALLNTYVADQIQRWAPAPPRSGIPPIDHDYVPTPHPAVDACDKRVSDDPDGRPSRQCGRPRREHQNHEGGK